MAFQSFSPNPNEMNLGIIGENLPAPWQVPTQFNLPAVVGTVGMAARGIMDIIDIFKGRRSATPAPPGGGGGMSFPGLGMQRPGTEGGGVSSEIAERLRGAVSGCPTMFRVMPQSTRALRMLEAVNPSTGKVHYWRHMGQPILFSGDLANCKRVGRVHARLNRARPRKR